MKMYTTPTTMLDNALEELSMSVWNTVRNMVKEHRFAAHIVAYNPIVVDPQTNTTYFTLMFITDDNDVEHISAIEMVIDPNGTPASVLVTPHDHNGLCFIDSKAKEFDTTVTTQEAVTTTAEIVIDLLRASAAAGIGNL